MTPTTPHGSRRVNAWACGPDVDDVAGQRSQHPGVELEVVGGVGNLRRCVELAGFGALESLSSPGGRGSRRTGPSARESAPAAAGRTIPQVRHAPPERHGRRRLRSPSAIIATVWPWAGLTDAKWRPETGGLTCPPIQCCHWAGSRVSLGHRSRDGVMCLCCHGIPRWLWSLPQCRHRARLILIIIMDTVLVTSRFTSSETRSMATLEGKVAIITGAGSGFGAATARRYVAEGAQVIIADINAENAERLARELGDRSLAAHVDVRDSDSVASMVEIAERAVRRPGHPGQQCRVVAQDRADHRTHRRSVRPGHGCERQGRVARRQACRAAAARNAAASSSISPRPVGWHRGRTRACTTRVKPRW